MSRFSPQVTHHPDDDFLAAAIANLGPQFFAGQDQARERRRQDEADARFDEIWERQQRDAEVDAINDGWRPGPGPDDSGRTVTLQDRPDAGIPSRLDSGGAPARRPRGSALGPDSFRRALTNEMESGGLPDSGDEGRGIPVEALSDLSSETLLGPRAARDPHANVAPGAFIQGMGFKGVSKPRADPYGSRSVHLGRTDHIVPLQDGRGHIDLTQTPEARASEARSAERDTEALRRREEFDYELDARSRARPQSGMTQSERLQLEDRRDRRLEAQQEFRRAMDSSNDADRGDREGGARQITIARSILTSLEREADAARSAVPTGLDRSVLEESDRGRARLDVLEQEARDAERAVRSARSELRALSPTGSGATSSAGATAKLTISQEQYDRAIAAGHSDATIRASYDVPSTVRRRR